MSEAEITDVKDLRKGIECTGILVGSMKVTGSKLTTWQKLNFKTSRTDDLYDSSLLMHFYDGFYENMTAHGDSADDMVRRTALSSVQVAIRQKYFNDKLEMAIENGIKQIIILGSGFDVRAVQFKHDDVKFYEVDSEKVLKLKRSIYAQKSIEPNAVYISMNYLEDGFLDALCQVGVDFKAPTLFIWEGNTMYLKKDDQNTFWNKIHANFEQYSLTFDFYTPETYEKLKSEQRFVEFVKNFNITFESFYEDLSDFCRINHVKQVELFDIEHLSHEFGINEDKTPEWRGYFVCYLQKN